MKLKVNASQRYAKMRAHTATHLLHAQLNKILWETKQAGSLVDEDYTRFDFTADQPLTEKQIQEIEENINYIISQWLDIEKKKMSFDEAIKEWAKAFFEEKYWDEVRVVKIWNEEVASMELCWGTHLDNSSSIWVFKIVSQEAVASGIRRVTAYTGPKVYEYIKEKEQLINEITWKIQANNEKQILEKIDKTLKEFEDLKSNYNSLQEKIISSILNELKNTSKSNEVFDYIINISESNDLKDINFKSISNKAKELFTDKNILTYNNEGNFFILINHWEKTAKDILKENWLKWWWPDTFAQWKDENIKNII